MLNNQTSYEAERNWVRDKDGNHLWLVAVKATFDIGSGGALKLADEQRPPLLEPEYFGDPGASSLKYDSDLLMPRTATDVLVHGCAHAPRGRLASKVLVRMRVGGVDKALVVHGERRYFRKSAGVGVTTSTPFETRSIRYEWAFGGSDAKGPDPKTHRFDSRNPIGKGIAADVRRLDGQLAHCVEYPQGDPSKVGPAGLGPIPSFWTPRLERAGTYGTAWERSRKPRLPEDYDERVSRCSPADQMLEKPLRGGERVELTNMTPDGLLTLELPRLSFAFKTSIAGRSEEHGAILAAVIIEPEERKLAMVWQTSLAVEQEDSDSLDLTTILESRVLP